MHRGPDGTDGAIPRGRPGTSPLFTEAPRAAGWRARQNKAFFPASRPARRPNTPRATELFGHRNDQPELLQQVDGAILPGYYPERVPRFCSRRPLLIEATDGTHDVPYAKSPRQSAGLCTLGVIQRCLSDEATERGPWFSPRTARRTSLFSRAHHQHAACRPV